MKEVKTNNGIKGGFLKGKPHYDSEGNSIGGIKAVVTDQGGKPVELEGNEVIINKKSVQSKKELTVKGTPKQILSTINQLDGNGVAIGDEEAEILAKYKTGGKIPNYHLGGDMSKHLAPNNEPSNLTHEQWHLVRTPEFKAWFGDWEEHPESSSKVVDENGEPLVVYHGTPVDFEKGTGEIIFKINKDGAHFGTKEQANDFFPLKIYECFLNIRNIQLGEDQEIAVNKIIESVKSEYGTDFLSAKMLKEVELLTPSYRDQLSVGFDGLKYINIMEGDQESFSYVVFKPNQIKLADGINVSFDSNNDDIRYKGGGNIGKMTKSELKKFYASPEGKKLDAETYSEWERLVNMTKSELQDFYNSKEGKEAGLSSHEAKELGIDSGRTSARWIMKMKDIPYTKWNDKMWIWAKKQISFIKRMSGMRGDLYDEKGTKTPKHTSLLIWGHNPERKFNLGGASSILINGYVSVQQIYVSENLTEEICLITYNSGGQSNLNVNDTMNATEMLKLFVDELDILSKNEFMQIIYDHRFNSNRIDSPEELDYYKNGFKTIIVDRDRIEFTNVPKKHNNELFAKGDGIEDFKENFELWIDKLNRNKQLPIEFTTSKSIEGTHKDSGYGDSYYIMIFDEDWNQYAKLRFSGHSVTNINRIKDEIHNPDISRFYEIVGYAMSSKQKTENPIGSIILKNGGGIEEEIIVYHGSPNKFNDFRTLNETVRGIELGSHFGNKKQAKTFVDSRNENGEDAYMYKCKLHLSNTLKVDDIGWWTTDNIYKFIINNKKYNFENNFIEKPTAETLLEFLRKQGIDSFKYNNLHEDEGASYLVFDKDKIEIIERIEMEKLEDGVSLENEVPQEIEETIVEKFKPYKTVDELSELHKVPVSEILDQLHIGEKVEMEHTNDYEIARIIALQHIEESPKYYTLLDKMEQSFELGGELKMNTGGEIEFKPITTPL